MIQNTSKVVFDIGDEKSLSTSSNPVMIPLFQPLLQISICRETNKVRINIINDTAQTVYCLTMIDQENNFRYRTKFFPSDNVIEIEYKITVDAEIFIYYYEKNNQSFNKVCLYL